jgi:hypothetical protein
MNIPSTFGVYNTSDLSLVSEKYTELKINEMYSIKPKTSLLISYEDVDINSYIPITPSKYYYHPTKTLSYSHQNGSTEYMNELGMFGFFYTNILTHNFINFKVNGEWYTIITNDEFTLQFIYDGNNRHFRIYFKGGDSAYFKVLNGLNKFKRSINTELPKPSILSTNLMDYYLFEGCRFYTPTFSNIVNLKKKISDILSDFKFMFVGTSIYDEARDVDIFIHSKDIQTASNVLSQHFSEIYHTPGHFGYLFYDNETSVKIDLLPSMYSNFNIGVNEDNSVDELTMYMIQSIYYLSSTHQNLSDMYRSWKFNKVIETAYRLDVLHTEYGYYNNSFISNERFELYDDVISNTKSNEVVEFPTIYNCKSACYKIGNTFYLMLKSLYFNQTINFNIDGGVNHIKVIDSSDIDTLIYNVDGDTTKVRIDNLNGYALISYEI